MSGNKGNGRLHRGAAGWFPLFEAMSPGGKGVPVPPASHPVPLPSSAPLPPLGYDAVSVFSPSLDIIF